MCSLGAEATATINKIVRNSYMVILMNYLRLSVEYLEIKKLLGTTVLKVPPHFHGLYFHIPPRFSE